MATWSKNNRACTTTWSTLRVLDQHDRVFKDSGTVKMSQLTFWNAAASPEMRKLQATTLAHQMDNMFRQIRGAKYEEGVERKQAIDGMVATLTDGNKTMSELAETIDAAYLFWGEEQL